jgi:cohesin complex subunit SA-1/2
LYFLQLRALATKSEEDTLIDEPANTEDVLVNDLLLPLARGLTANWNDGSRREAGIVLAHITGSGSEAAQVVQVMARQLKKVSIVIIVLQHDSYLVVSNVFSVAPQINPVRFLEAEMACLRLSFEKWVNNEPEELETDRPSEEQLNQYEEAERKHEALFHLIEQQATQLSRCLGVGKITAKKLSRALLGFLQEGVRFAFHGDKGEEDELVLGSRLPFLLILCKYSTWIKKDKQQIAIMRENLNDNEEELRAHPEFNDVHEDDLAALARFRESLGIKVTRFSTQNSVMGSPNTQGDYSLEDDRTDGGATATPSPGAGSTVSGRRRISTAGSHMSRMSAQNSLSPLPEEDAVGEDSNEEEEDSPPKRRRLAGSQRSGRGDSLGSSITMSTAMAKSQSRIDEEEESSEGEDGPFD